MSNRDERGEGRRSFVDGLSTVLLLLERALECVELVFMQYMKLKAPSNGMEEALGCAGLQRVAGYRSKYEKDLNVLDRERVSALARNDLWLALPELF